MLSIHPLRFQVLMEVVSSRLCFETSGHRLRAAHPLAQYLLKALLRVHSDHLTKQIHPMSSGLKTILSNP